MAPLLCHNDVIWSYGWNNSEMSKPVILGVWPLNFHDSDQESSVFDTLERLEVIECLFIRKPKNFIKKSGKPQNMLT